MNIILYLIFFCEDEKIMDCLIKLKTIILTEVFQSYCTLIGRPNVTRAPLRSIFRKVNFGLLTNNLMADKSISLLILFTTSKWFKVPSNST